MIFIIIIPALWSHWLLSMMLGSMVEQGLTEVREIELLVMLNLILHNLLGPVSDISDLVLEMFPSLIQINFGRIEIGFLVIHWWSLLVLRFETKVWNIDSVDILFVIWVLGMSHSSSHGINRVGTVNTVVVHGNVLILLIKPVVNHLILEVLAVHDGQESDEGSHASDLVDSLLEMHHLL